MSQTLVRVLVHLIFSTRHREPYITPAIEPELFAFIGGICRAHDSPLIAAGGTEDHIHLLVSLSKTSALSNLLMHVKKDSSRWIKTKGPEFSRFGWQDGFAGLSVGQSQVPAIERYFSGQREHHKRTTFREEVLAFLKKYRVDYDPQYIWD